MTDLQTQTTGRPPGAPPALAGTDDLPPERGRGRRWVALGLVIALVLGGGTYAAVRFMSVAEDRAIDLVPHEAMGYANVFLEPSTAQRRAIRDLLQRLPVGTPDRAQTLIADLLDAPLSEFGLRFERDVEPWLGDQIAGFILPPRSSEADFHGGVVISTTDERATRAALQRYRTENDVTAEAATYKDHQIEIEANDVVTGFLNSFLFVGTRRGFEAAADALASGRSLETSDTYIDAVRGLETDRLAVVYFDGSELATLIEAEGGRPLGLGTLGSTFGQAQAAVLYATPVSLVVDQSSDIPGAGGGLFGAIGEAGIMERLPRDAWLALDVPNVGAMAKALFAQATSFLPGGLGPAAANERIKRQTGLDLHADVFDWMEDAALYVSGTNRVDIGGGILFSSSKPSVSRKAVHKIAGVLIAQGTPVTQRTWTWQGNIDIGNDGKETKGYAVDVDVEQPVNLVADEDRVVLAYGDEATGQALDASSYMGDGLEWREAIKTLDEAYVPFFYVDLQAAKVAIEAFGADSEPMYVEDVRPWLGSMSHILSGAQRRRNKVFTRTVIGVL